MSIFSKQLQDIVFGDIQELLDEKIQENIRLEYKKKLPQKKEKEELVKKISSMANTYGGYIVIGIEEDGKGNPKSIYGVAKKKGFKQQVIQWCYNEVYPPITPFFSNPIPNKLRKNTFIYVIYVDMSLDSPHFLTKRRGCYIRTDEYSERFSPQLATYENMTFLAERRRLAEKKRDDLVKRSQRRFSLYRDRRHTFYSQTTTQTSQSLNNINPSFLNINLIPQYPHSKLITEHELLGLVPKIKFSTYRGQKIYPPDRMCSQFESVIFRFAVSEFSYLELNVYGQVSYFRAISQKRDFGGANIKIIHEIIDVKHIFAFIIQNVLCGKLYLRQLGYDGLVNFRVVLDNLIGKKIFSEAYDIEDFSKQEDYRTHLFSLVDNSIGFEIEVDTAQNWNEMCLNMFRNILFSLNEQDAFENRDIEGYLDRSLIFIGIDKDKAKKFLEK